MTLKSDVDKTKTDAKVVEADVAQDVRDAEAEGVAAVRAVTGLAEDEAKRVVAEVRKILGLPTSSPVNQHVDGTADQKRGGDLTPAETADQPKTYEPHRSPAETPVSPTDKPVTK